MRSISFSWSVLQGLTSRVILNSILHFRDKHRSTQRALSDFQEISKAVSKLGVSLWEGKMSAVRAVIVRAAVKLGVNSEPSAEVRSLACHGKLTSFNRTKYVKHVKLP